MRRFGSSYSAMVMIRNSELLRCHLEWRLCIRILSACDGKMVDQFLYDDAMSGIVPLSYAITTILLSTTMQLQVATRKRVLHPESDRRSFSEVCLSDVRRCVYAIQILNRAICQCSSVNLFFEDVLCVCSLVVLSLHKALREYEQVCQQNTVSEDVDALHSGEIPQFVISVEMDSLLYQLFAGKRLSLDRFAVPKEYYPIVSRYLD